MSLSNDDNRSYKFSVTPDYFRTVAQPGGSGMRFSRTEVNHIVISVAVLTIAFAISIIGGVRNLPGLDLTLFAYVIGASFLAVASGFLLHELSHKRVAQGYGCFAEFRMYPMGLVFGLLTSFFGVLLALPGAVMIAGRITKKQNGIISVAGPAVNLLIGSICLVAALALEKDSLPWLVIGIVAFVDIFLAVFNMLPIPPLDGSKVFQWNIFVFLGVMAVAIAMLVVFNQYMWTFY